MMNKYFCNQITWYRTKGYETRKKFINFLIYVCLAVYVLGFLNVFLNNLYEYNGLVSVKSCNDCSRNLAEVKSPNNKKLKKGFFKNEKKSKKKNKVNKEDNDEQNTDGSKSCCNGNSESNQVENENDDSTNYLNYQDLSVQLTKEQLYNVLNSLTKVPKKENLINLWSQALGVNKEGLDDLLKDLLTYFPKNKITDGFAFRKFHQLDDPHLEMWYKFLKFFAEATSNEKDFTSKYYGLINRKPSIDDIRHNIFSFLEEYQKTYTEIYNKCKKEAIALKNNNI
ncbi:Plasmodium exported protein (PHISTa), unknown function [Plasmodium gaboni]|uniref:Plasmodium RESA N-terminal domain-containing protein n=1 Tax=Plasmodium gaboni TaxID=647221 RepID=A0ABY0KW02_9APIC|nr:Plasmodium exported protein (PHISTa), unknown function [Plasmodium gaboni]